MERKKASDYPQELLDLFHEYQHGDIDRRTFLDRAAKFAVGGLTVAAIFEGMKPNYAWAQQVKNDDSRIKVGYETVPSPQGNGSIKGYFAKPANASGKLPGILVIHENRGLNPYVEDVARRFAVANFVAYAPDGLTSVGGFPGNDEQGAVKFREVNGPKMFEDFVAAAQWLKARPESTGKLGAVDVPKIKAPLMLHYADPTKDTGIGARIPGYEAALKANNKTYQLFIYE